jgi:hypothetical protein
MLHRPWLVVSLSVAVACSSKSGASPGGAPDASSHDAGLLTLPEASPGTSVVHGTMVDYESLNPVAGLDVTDGDQSTTTDAHGQWALTVPTGSTLQVNVTNASYSRLLFPDLVAEAPDVDLTTIVIPDTGTYRLAKQVASGIDESKALVWLMVYTKPSCASPVGGTVSVTSPSGTSTLYFATGSLPSAGITSFQDVSPGRPVAVIYNVDPAGTLSVAVTHPTCKMVPFPATFDGRTYPGTLRLQAAQDGSNEALVVVME